MARVTMARSRPGVAIHRFTRFVGSIVHRLLQPSLHPGTSDETAFRHREAIRPEGRFEGRAGQAVAAASAVGVADPLPPRYASPVAIMAHTTRAILLARATAP